MEKEKQNIFNEFTKKVVKRLRDRKVRKFRSLYVPSLDDNIKIRNLDYSEIVECTECEDEKDPNQSDKYAIYLAVVEPDLKETAKQLKETGEIIQYIDVVDIFEMSEVTDIAMEIMKLSGVIGAKKVTVVEELKN